MGCKEPQTAIWLEMWLNSSGKIYEGGVPSSAVSHPQRQLKDTHHANRSDRDCSNSYTPSIAPQSLHSTANFAVHASLSPPCHYAHPAQAIPDICRFV